jgi:hypothetical protein
MTIRWGRGTGVIAVSTALTLTAPGVAAGTASATAARAAPAKTCPLPVFGPGSAYHPTINPANFSANVTNPLYPLTPGTTLLYTGVKDGKPALDVFAITATATIDGVQTRLVQDRLFLSNVLEERTTDYYSQDSCGNVWYFGEDTATLDKHGHVVSTAGSFHAGVDRAQPGVFMQARPQVGRQFRQEWYAGQAEDVFSVAQLSTPITVPYGSFHNSMRTAEHTALEPGVLDNKWYVQGIGEVVELTIHGPLEKLVLVDVIH